MGPKFYIQAQKQPVVRSVETKRQVFKFLADQERRGKSLEGFELAEDVLKPGAHC
jgi:hypothetical protein